MKIVFSSHAKARMAERKITQKDVISALLQPDRVERDGTGENRFMAKRIYQTKIKRGIHLLLIIYEFNENTLHVITVISTSKITKYL